MPLYKKYGDRKPDGIYSFNAFFGVLFFYPDEEDDTWDCDFICCCESNGFRYGFRRHKIHDNYVDGRDYIYKGNQKIYLCDVIRKEMF